jgi:proliferating cell nuclear antigen
MEDTLTTPDIKKGRAKRSDASDIEAAAGNPAYGLEIKTVQASVFKILIEALKEILTDTVVEISDAGIKVVALDNTHVILIHLVLDANKFEFYHCDAPRKIGINMLNFYKIIKTINSNDTLTLFMKKNDNNHLGIEIENREKNSKTTYKLNLLDLDNTKLQIPEASFNSIITLPSTDFQKICRDMHNLAEFVEIKTVNKELILTCKGDFCTQETVIRDSDSVTVENEENEQEIVQGVFSLKFLCLFTKATNLSKVVEIFLNNSFPLIVRYSVASLGEIKMCLAPQTE